MPGVYDDADGVHVGHVVDGRADATQLVVVQAEAESLPVADSASVGAFSMGSMVIRRAPLRCSVAARG